MTAGRPPKYNTVEEMQRLIDLYFLACKCHQTNDAGLLEELSIEDMQVVNDIDDVCPTVCGLAYALDLTRKGLVDYEGKDEFCATVKKAKQRVESFLEQRLYHAAPAGTIFNLKNNFGWKDQNALEVTGKDGGPIQSIERVIVDSPADSDS